MDVKGAQKGAIANTYDMVKNLISLGYDAKILHDKNDYLEFHPAGWLGDEYLAIPHVSMESKPGIRPEDFIVVPEVFGSIMKGMAENKFPSKNVVLCQSPEYIFETLEGGHTWGMYNFTDVITTNNSISDYVKDVFPMVKTHVVSPVVSDCFKSNTKLKQPIVAVHTRNQSDFSKIYKSFLVKYPMLRWVPFKDLRGLPKEEFADVLRSACLSVWVDDIAGFGTFPLESIECDTPVIVKLPNQVPDWAIEPTDDGIKLNDIAIWTDNVVAIPNMINSFMQTYLEDTIDEELLANMVAAKGGYIADKQKDELETTFSTMIEERIKEFKTLIVG